MRQNKYRLEAPEEYWQLSKSERKEIVNNCGPDGSINKLIPDHLLGLGIADICNIHDVTFARAKSQKDHKKSDRLFLKNMNNRIENDSKTYFGKVVRKALAMIYFIAARVYSSFQKNKENKAINAKANP